MSLWSDIGDVFEGAANAGRDGLGVAWDVATAVGGGAGKAADVVVPDVIGENFRGGWSDTFHFIGDTYSKFGRLNSTAYQTIDDIATGRGVDPQKAWDRNISPGEAILATASGTKSGMTYDNVKSYARGGGDHYSPWAQLTSGSLDLVSSWYADPFVLAGKGVKVSHDALTVVRPGDLAAIKAGEDGAKVSTRQKAVANRFDALVNETNGKNTAQLLQYGFLRDNEAGDTIASLIAAANKRADDEVAQGAVAHEVKATRDSRVKDILRVGMGDMDTLARLKAENDTLAFDMENLNQSLDWMTDAATSPVASARMTERLSQKIADTQSEIGARESYQRELDKFLDPQNGAYGRLGTRIQGANVFDRHRLNNLDRTSGVAHGILQDGVGSTPVHIFDYVTGARPAGVVNLHDAADVNMQLGHQMQRVKGLDPETKQKWLTRVGDANDDASRQVVVQQIEDQVFMHVARQVLGDDVKRETVDSILQDYRLKHADAAQRAYPQQSFAGGMDPQTGQRLDLWNDGEGNWMARPVTSTQLANSLPLMDVDEVYRVLKRHKSQIRAFAGAGIDPVNAMANTGLTVWKFGKLARLGYPIRTVADAQIRMLAVLGGASHAFEVMGPGIGNLARNAVTKGEKRRLGLGEVNIRGYKVPDFHGATAADYEASVHHIDAKQTFENLMGSEQQFLRKSLRGSGQFTVRHGDDPLYEGDWLRAANLQLRQDPLVQRMLGFTETQVRDSAERVAVQQRLAEVERELATNPQKLYRRDASTAEMSPAKKPQGLYVSINRPGFVSPFAGTSPSKVDVGDTDFHFASKVDLGGDDVLRPEPFTLSFQGLRGREAIEAPVDAGVAALRQLVGTEQFDEMVAIGRQGKDALKEHLKQLPGGKLVRWDQFYDPYEMLMAYGGIAARRAGYKGIYHTDALDSNMDEFVALTDDALEDLKAFESRRSGVSTEKAILEARLARPAETVDVLKAPSEAEVAAWLKKTPEGRSVAKRLRPIYDDDYAEMVRKHNLLIDNVTGGNDGLRMALAKGDVALSDLKKAYPTPSSRPSINGEVLDSTMNKGPVADLWAKTLRGFYKVTSDIPETQLGRHPMAVVFYRRHLDDLIGHADPKGLGTLAPDDLERIRTAAVSLARRDMKRTLYNISSQPNMAAGMWKFIFPFFGAFQDVALKYGKLIYDDPARLARANLVLDAPNRAGLTVDKDGNIVGPGHPLGDGQFIVVPSIPGFSSIAKWKLSKQSANVVLAGDPVWLPGFGPLMGVSANEVAKRYPRTESMFDKAGLLPFGAQESSFNMINPAPTWGVQLWRASHPDNAEYREVYAQILASESMAIRDGSRKNPGEQELLDEVGSRTSAWFMARAVANFGMPLSATPITKYQLYFDLAHKYQDPAWQKQHPELFRTIDPKTGAATPVAASEAFYRDHPQYFDAMVSLSKNNTGIQATNEGVDASKRWSKEIAKFPEFGAMFVGPEDEGEFSSAARANQLSTRVGPGTSERFREKKDPVQAMKDINVSRGWITYRQWADKIDVALATRKAQGGSDSLAATANGDLAAAKKIIVDDLSKQNADWFYDYQQRDQSRLPKFLAAAQIAVDSPKAKGRGDLDALRIYLDYRERFQKVLAQRATGGGSTSLSAQSNADLAQAWGILTTDLKSRYVTFSDIFTRNLEGDDLSQKAVQ